MKTVKLKMSYHELIIINNVLCDLFNLKEYRPYYDLALICSTKNYKNGNLILSVENTLALQDCIYEYLSPDMLWWSENRYDNIFLESIKDSISVKCKEDLKSYYSRKYTVR